MNDQEAIDALIADVEARHRGKFIVKELWRADIGGDVVKFVPFRKYAAPVTVDLVEGIYSIIVADMDIDGYRNQPPNADEWSKSIVLAVAQMGALKVRSSFLGVPIGTRLAIPGLRHYFGQTGRFSFSCPREVRTLVTRRTVWRRTSR